jgi:SAM-dependent methyltransferase
MTRWTGIASTRTWPSGSATRTTRFWCSRSFEAARPSRVLDVGFGAGRRVVYLARSGYRVHGIDVSEQGKEYVERLLAAGGLTTEPGGRVPSRTSGSGLLWRWTLTVGMLASGFADRAAVDSRGPRRRLR